MVQRNRYIKWGMTVFFTVSAILLFYDTLFGNRALFSFSRKCLSATKPILYGAFMAYLLAPVVDFFDTAAQKSGLAKAVGRKGRKVPLCIRAISILLAWSIIGFLLYLLGSVLLPELYKSVIQLISNVETYYKTISGWIHHLLETNQVLETWAVQQMDTYYHSLETWVRTDLLPRATTLMTIVSGRVLDAIAAMGDLLVGVIVSIYFLATKEACAAQACRITYSLFPQRKVYWILRGTHKADRIFAGFVRGKLLDSLIIGILCFICCSILKFPYTPLVSVIVGATNIIPFFGPFLGAVPSTFLILLASPIKALYFVIFILALQQLDGNVIGPKILGDKTGLSSLWVIFAILVGGSFFGIAGMFFGVPIFACLYSAANFYVETRLREKNLPTQTDAYTNGSPDTSEVNQPLETKDFTEI